MIIAHNEQLLAMSENLCSPQTRLRIKPLVLRKYHIIFAKNVSVILAAENEHITLGVNLVILPLKGVVAHRKGEKGGAPMVSVEVAVHHLPLFRTA